MKKILIATTNPGKFQEIVTEFGDLSFTFVNLKDVKIDSAELEEPYNTTWENAIHKARYFANKTGLITIAEDSGLFIKHLGGAPGVHVKRAAPTEKERVEKILKELKGVSMAKRGAAMLTHACIFDPSRDSFSVFEGRLDGKIAEKITGTSRPGMEHDVIFFYPPFKKTLAELSLLEKNRISHRGQVINQLRHFLSRNHTPRHIVVPLAIITHKRKMLILQRRDSRKDFNNKWEFPGGGVENGESVETALLRECREETGFSVKIEERLPGIYTTFQGEGKGNYQVFLIPFLCTVRSGTFKTSDIETAGHRWVRFSESLKVDFLSLNKNIIRDNKNLIKKYID